MVEMCLVRLWYMTTVAVNRLGEAIRQGSRRADPIDAHRVRLLSTLLRNVGRVVSHEDLIREVWGTEESASLAS